MINNWLDITVAIVLIVAFFSGFNKGLLMQVAGLGAIILGAVFAGKLAKIILPELVKYIDMPSNTASVVAYILAFALIVIAIGFVGKLLENFFKAVNLSFINRILGAILALATAMVVMSIVLNLALMLDSKEDVITPDLKEKSFFYARVQAVVPAIVPYLNKDVWEKYIPEEYRKKEEQEKSDFNNEETVIVQRTTNFKTIKRKINRC